MIRKYLVIIILLLTAHVADAQKVGLVLSGGGSKGVSHIGVIRALEEAEIPIDYITGTSMGAIIGGLYASGYSPDEMEAIITSPEFVYWSTGKIDPRYTYYFKAPTPNAAWLDLKFNIDSIIKPSLPTNLISPMMMDFAFLELFSSAGAVADYDFNKLMVPFKCIASDISEAKQVVLSKGDLGSSIRASMTFPFYFKPIRIDSVLLFDGGMYNNFPADIMLEYFNPDIIIGSQASANAGKPDVYNVMSQIENMLMMKSNFNVICDNSVMIKPNLLDVNVVDFSHTQAFIDSGYVQANRVIPSIREFVVEHRSKEEIDSIRQGFNLRKPELYIGAIQINGLKNSQYQYMDQLLRKDALGWPVRKVGNKILTLNMIKPQYYRFIAEGKIGSVYPRLWYDKEAGKYNLTLDIERQNQLVTEIGGTITSSSVNEFFLQIKYFLWTSKSMQFVANSYFGRFYNSALFESRIDVPKYNPYYLSLGFVYNKFNYFKTSTFFYADEDPFFIMEQEQFGYFSAGFPLHNNGKIVIDLTAGGNRDQYFQTNTYSRDDILDRTSFRFLAPGIYLEKNSLNYKEYANRGSFFRTEVYMVTGNEFFYPGSTTEDKRVLKIPHTWIQGKMEFENFFASLGKSSFGIFSQINYSTQTYFSNYTASILSASAFQPISESSVKFMPVYRANKFMALGSKNVYSITKNIDFRLEGYLFMVMDALEKDAVTTKSQSATGIQFSPMASSVLVYRTPIGPISLNLNYFSGEDKPVSFFFKLGYLIFNRRPF